MKFKDGNFSQFSIFDNLRTSVIFVKPRLGSEGFAKVSERSRFRSGGHFSPYRSNYYSV